MQIVKYRRNLPQYRVVERFFSPEEVEKIIDLEELQNFNKGRVGNSEGQFDANVRDSDISWLSRTRESEWLFFRFHDLVGDVNHDCFMYDIDGFESFQYTRYKKNQHYSWHFDAFTQYTTWERKISAVIILTEPNKYEGGELQVVTNGNIEQPMTFKPPAGSVVFFASWMPHRVAPVQKGVRRSLVAWIMGKRVC